MSDPNQEPTPPIASAQPAHIVEPQIPNVNIPHMGTSRADVPMPSFTTTGTEGGPVAPPPVQVAPMAAPVALAPLPEGISQEMIHAAIRQVEQTGNTDGIAPQILVAACQQIEAQAAQQGIDLSQAVAPGQPAQPAPANYVEAAVMDKKGTFDTFTRHRDSLKSSVAQQRQAAQRPYQDALQKAHGGGDGGDGEAADEIAMMKVLAAELSALDPQTIALINAMGVLSNTPEVLKSLVWLEIIRAVRNLIRSQTKQQVEACLKETTAA
jgi:hypothetical protein